MSWWSTVLGGAVGFVLGGPLGALLGAALGHGLGQSRDTTLAGVERAQTAFFTAVFSVMGHMAKSDGLVSRDEIRLASRVMDRMDLPEPQRELARRLFREGKRVDFPLDEALNQLVRECRSRNLLRMFLEIQAFAAWADGQVHTAERAILERVATRLGFAPAELAQVERLVEAELAGEFSHHDDPRGAPLEDAYALLGVSAEDDDDTVKRAYRRLMSQHHPDRLVSRGLPEEMMKLANAKAQEIRGAYDRVKAARGMR
jgi:DnaJ like chaperone protein